ncbi:MAG: signal peptidase II [Clostridia bacterium]|nr:signal peptidase II [Clostridia bacterium]
MKILLFAFIAIIVVLADRMTKRNAVKKGHRIVYNKGAFIGLLKKRKKLLSFFQIISIGILIFLFFYYDFFLFQIGLCFILGGSIGNSYEHIIKGAVTDFIRIGKLYVNLADICIFSGLLIIIIFMLVSI